MGRKTFKPELIPNAKNRLATYRKRLKGIEKKAFELSTLCDIDVCMIIYGPTDQTGPHVQPQTSIWPPNSDCVGHIINRYRNKPVTLPTKYRKESVNLSTMLANQKKKLEEGTSKLTDKYYESKYPKWDPRIEQLTKDEMDQTLEKVSNQIEVVKNKIDVINKRKKSLVTYQHHEDKMACPSTNNATITGLNTNNPTPLNQITAVNHDNDRDDDDRVLISDQLIMIPASSQPPPMFQILPHQEGNAVKNEDDRDDDQVLLSDQLIMNIPASSRPPPMFHILPNQDQGVNNFCPNDITESNYINQTGLMFLQGNINTTGLLNVGTSNFGRYNNPMALDQYYNDVNPFVRAQWHGCNSSSYQGLSYNHGSYNQCSEMMDMMDGRDCMDNQGVLQGQQDHGHDHHQHMMNNNFQPLMTSNNNNNNGMIMGSGSVDQSMMYYGGRDPRRQHVGPMGSNYGPFQMMMMQDLVFKNDKY